MGQRFRGVDDRFAGRQHPARWGVMDFVAPFLIVLAFYLQYASAYQ